MVNPLPHVDPVAKAASCRIGQSHLPHAGGWLGATCKRLRRVAFALGVPLGVALGLPLGVPLACALGLGTLAGCGGPDYGDAFLMPYRAAQRAKSAGRYDEAAHHYLAAAEGAQRVKDRDEAYFNQALMYERLEQWPKARAVYRRIIAVSPDGPRTARSAFEHATSHIDHGDEKVGWTELVNAIERYPNHGVAPYSIRRWIMHTSETGGEGVVRSQLQAWLTKLTGTALVQQLKYEMGKSFARSDAHQKAHAWLLRAAREHPYPQGNLTDDALWHAADVAQAMSNHTLALADLSELLSDREDSEVTFSYERPRFPQAQMRIAEIYRDAQSDRPRARVEFRRMFERHPTSVLADDAMWQAAILARAAGDQKDVCALSTDLPKRFPDSRYLKCVRVICPAAPKSDRHCPDYILRDIPENPGAGSR